MGNKQSSSVRSLNQSITENLNNIVKTNTSKQNTIQVNRNNATIDVGGSILYCNVTNNQHIDTSQVQKAIQRVDNTVELISKLNEAMEAAGKSNQAASTAFLQTTFGSQKNEVESMNIMKSTVKNNITEENLQELNAVIDNANNFKLKIGGDLVCDSKSGKIENLQEIRTSQVAGAMQDILTKTLVKNEQIRKSLAKSEASQSQKGGGLAEITGPMFMMIAVIVIALIVGGVFLFKSLLSSPEAMDLVKSKVGR
jgi:hypothetical protein